MDEGWPRKRLVHAALCAGIFFGCNAQVCRCSDPVQTSRAPVDAVEAKAQTATQPPDTRPGVSEPVYDSGLKNDWQDWGWGPHESTNNGPIKIRFDDWGGLIFAKPGNSGDFGGVRFHIASPIESIDFLGLRLESNGTKLPDIPLAREHCADIGNGWTEVFVPFEQLNPDKVPVVDRIIFHARRPMNTDFISIDKVELTKPVPRRIVEYDSSRLQQVTMSIDCAAKAAKISPYIYGFADYEFNDENAQAAQWLLGGTARRWGGNTTSTYNWERGTWNTGNDWFFENHPMSHKPFLKDNAAHGVATALTVPMLGWVAKDATSSSFPVSLFGPQEATDQWRSDAGNGKAKSGKPIKPGPQSRAYQPVTSAFVKHWVESIRKDDAKTGKRSVWMYILDNEPMIWSTTHRDAHPDPVSYDELVNRTIEYGTAIREADPDALIAGPAEWGWTGFMYSGKDMANGGPSVRPDRRAHGDLPVVAYYLRALAEHAQKTGVRVLDVLDLHGYPYADEVAGAHADAKAAALRIRSTRMLWDPSYVDESWVKEPVKLLPRMREWIDTYYPGRGMSLGEWNFGGEGHMSGGLAIAEALGRFAQFKLTSAFYWTYPAGNSPAMWAFRAYRNYDGAGSHFLDWYTPASVKADHSREASLFASRDGSGKRLVAVLLNFSKTEAVAANVDLTSCGRPSAVRAFAYEGGPGGYSERKTAATRARSLVHSLPPYSITVLDIQLSESGPVVH